MWLALRIVRKPLTTAATLAAPPDASATSSAPVFVRQAASQVEQWKSSARIPS
jgi:hypothetical protein